MHLDLNGRAVGSHCWTLTCRDSSLCVVQQYLAMPIPPISRAGQQSTDHFAVCSYVRKTCWFGGGGRRTQSKFRLICAVLRKSVRGLSMLLAQRNKATANIMVRIAPMIAQSYHAAGSNIIIIARQQSLDIAQTGHPVLGLYISLLLMLIVSLVLFQKRLQHPVHQRPQVAMEVFGLDHHHLLTRALRNTLFTELAGITYAQFFDCLPTNSQYCLRYASILDVP